MHTMTQTSSSAIADARSCFSKKVYYSATVADEVIRKALVQRGVLLRKYVCDKCSLYHVTKKV